MRELAATRIGRTFNQYAGGFRAAQLRVRLVEYLEKRVAAPLLLVGEAAGFRGARISGIPFTSERQFVGAGPAEQTATVMHRVLAELGLEEHVLLWNVVPTHPGTASSNRRPTRIEVEAASPFLVELARGRRVVAVGRLAESRLAGHYVRHPSRGGAEAFRRGLLELLDRGELELGSGRLPVARRMMRDSRQGRRSAHIENVGATEDAASRRAAPRRDMATRSELSSYLDPA